MSAKVRVSGRPRSDGGCGGSCGSCGSGGGAKDLGPGVPRRLGPPAGERAPRFWRPPCIWLRLSLGWCGLWPTMQCPKCILLCQRVRCLGSVILFGNRLNSEIDRCMESCRKSKSLCSDTLQAGNNLLTMITCYYWVRFLFWIIANFSVKYTVFVSSKQNTN